MKQRVIVLILLADLLSVSALCAATEDVYRVSLNALKTESNWPLSDAAVEPFTWQQQKDLLYFLPYASVDEGQVVTDFGDWNLPLDAYQIHSVAQLIQRCSVLIKTTRKPPFSGVLFVPRPDLSGMTRVRFNVASDTAPLSNEAGLKAFFAAMQKHYDLLLRQDLTGDAWFRYQSIKADAAQQRRSVFDPNRVQTEMSGTRPDPFRSAYALFTGEQAVRENIQLDRTLRTTLNQPRTVELSSIEGITTAQIDWKPLIEGKVIETDPLADYIPADQHAVFYPTFRDMVELMDAIREGRQSLEPLGFSVDRLDWYEQQMCVWLDGWSRFWGPKTIRGVALTGSDPYMAEGTDSAILFDAAVGGLVFGNTESKQEKKLKDMPSAKLLKGSIDGVDYRAVVSPDRRVSSYLAQIDNVVVVTNSLTQLEKIVRASRKKVTPMSQADEYKFFRARYDQKNSEQTALVVLTDAAIRRWCSPQWRIGTARRALAASVLAHAQAAWIDDPRAFSLPQAQEFLSHWIPDIGTVTLTEAGVTSSVYGSMLFRTPVAELPIDKVSPEEQRQYERFRDMYQRRWQAFFDPIGICYLHENRNQKIDLTVRPLIADSEYRPWMQIAGRNTLQAGDGDPHPESIAHLVFAIDKNSEPVRQAGQFARSMIPADTGVSAFDWLGRWVTVYMDDGPFWQEFSEKAQRKGIEAAFEDCITDDLNAVPLAVAAQVENPVVLSAFLLSLRAWIDQTLGGMTTWQAKTYKEKNYTAITVQLDSEQSQSFYVYYAVISDQLLVSLNESLVTRALDRSDRNKKNTHVWAGEHMAVSIDEKGWKVIELLARESYAQWLRKKAWSNLPLLTEWHAQAGRLSEAEFYKQFWNVSLDSPAGTEYEWNKTLQAVESSLFGHPAAPKMPAEIETPLSNVRQADMGITFEEDGLRAKINIRHEK